MRVVVGLVMGWVATAQAGEGVFAEWAERATAELSIDGFRPSRTVVAAQDRERWAVSAVLGSLFTETEDRSRPGRVEVIVGDDGLDSSRYGDRAGENPRRRPNFVVEDVPLALARDLWLTTDASFKDAVQRYRTKSVALAQVPTPYPPDWTAVPPVTSVEQLERTTFDREALRRLAVEGSAIYRKVPGIRSGWVEIVVEQTEIEVVSSDGTRIVRPEELAVVYTWCDLLRADGVQVFEEAQHIAVRASDLPDAATLIAGIEAMAARVAARAAAPVVDYYEGPVLFEGQAAAQLFTYLLTGELEGTPPAPRGSSTYAQLTRSGPRIGRRLLPGGWTVVDDPTRWPAKVPGAYTVDLEGVAAQAVTLVEDGVVRDLAMSRVPRPERPTSNGHARGTIGGDWTGRLSAWEVTPDKALSARAFDKAVGKVVRGDRLERLLVVRSMSRGRPGALPRPMDAVWRYADGHEEPVPSIAFQNTDRRLLKDLLAVGGGRVTRPYLAPGSQGGLEGTTVGLPSVLTAPARVLVGEIEASFPGSDRQTDSYPMPGLP